MEKQIVKESISKRDIILNESFRLFLKCEIVVESEYTSSDLRKMAENAKTFDGKPLNEDDIEAIQNIIEIYLNKK